MSQQQQQQQLLKTLEELLKLPENRDCADCGTKAPRWSSTNLGIFVCIRCSGIHRAMGTHISKVKSVSLDKWTPEQVEFMQKMGNAKAKEIYEANVDGYQKGDIRTDNIALEQWIRDKYEHKRFMRRDYDPRQNAPAHHHNHHHSSHSSHSNNSSSHSNNSSSSSQPTRPRQASNPTPVSRPPAQPKSLPPVSAPAPLAAPQAKPVGDLLDWDAPVAAPAPANPAPTAAAPAANTSSKDIFGDFGDFVSATPSQPALPAAPAPVDKNSILQLYNTPIAPQAAFHPYGVPQQQMHYPGPNYNITGLGVPGAMHPGMMGVPHPGMGMNPGMGMGGVPQMGMGMGGVPPGMGMNPGMGSQGMMPGMGVPGMAPGYPGMGGVPQYYGIPNQQLGMRPTGVPNQTF